MAKCDSYRMEPRLRHALAAALVWGDDIEHISIRIVRGTSQGSLFDSLRLYNNDQVVTCAFDCFMPFDGDTKKYTPREVVKMADEVKNIMWLMVRLRSLTLLYRNKNQEGLWLFLGQIVADERRGKDGTAISQNVHYGEYVIGKFKAGLRGGNLFFVDDFFDK